MKEVEFSCTSCRSALSASKSDYGELVQCPSCNHTMKVPRYGVVGGMKLGDFKVLKCLGVGGMGEVWLAEQESLQRRVALKILSPDISNDESFINRFNQEVKTAGKLIHPNIVVAFHAGEQNGIRYLTSAYVDGLVASEALEINGAMPEAEVLKIGRDVAKGLKYAWEKQHIVHRDVKPDNIMLAKDGTPMLMDMGISKNFDEDISLTMTGEIIGTPYYISPEQAHAADEIDFRSDQYSLGATLFHLLTGQLPYQATSAMGILAQHLQNPVPNAREINSEISKGCAKMIQKMMAKKPEGRYQSWDEFIIFANSLLPPEMRDGTILPGSLKAPKRSSAKPIIIGALAGVIVIAILLSAFLTKRHIGRKNSQNSKIKRPLSDVTNTAPAKTEPDKPARADTRPTSPDRPLETDNSKEPDRTVRDTASPRSRMKAQIKNRMINNTKEKFGASQQSAEIIADKWFQFQTKKKEFGNSNLSHDERKAKLEPLKKELLDTVAEELGESTKQKFEQFMKHAELHKGGRDTGGRRRLR